MNRSWCASIATSACLLACALACGSPLNEAGTGCKVDGECSAGLACLPLSNAPAQDCRTLFYTCSKPCKADADCIAVAPNFKCTPTCDGAGTCGKTR